jgi:DNA-binding beta-propeller fold protein YncE
MKPILPAFIISICLVSSSFASAADSLIAGKPVELTGTQGKFDFIKIDAANGRLLACHTGNGSLDVIDVATCRLIKSVPTGAAQGVAIDSKNGRYLVSVSKPPQLAMIDSAKLVVLGVVPLPGPADLVAYQPETDRVFVCNDEKPEMWIIDPVAKSILTTIAFPGGGMEDLGFDKGDNLLFQCLKDSSQLAKFDPKEGKISETWPTAPAEKPHGLAILPDSNQVLIVGGNGKLGLFSLSTGKLAASADVSPRVDEIAYDPGAQRVYCASGLGTISVVAVDHDQLTTLAPLPSSAGAHSIAVDPRTHTVWIVFAKDGKPYVQSFAAK